MTGLYRYQQKRALGPRAVPVCGLFSAPWLRCLIREGPTEHGRHMTRLPTAFRVHELVDETPQSLVIMSRPTRLSALMFTFSIVENMLL